MSVCSILARASSRVAIARGADRTERGTALRYRVERLTLTWGVHMRWSFSRAA